MIAIWLDPGLLTGVCAVEAETGQVLLLDEFDLLRTGEQLEKFLDGFVSVSVGWETYTIMKGPQTQAPWSLEVIGVARYLTEKYGHKQLKPAAPKQREVCTLTMLKEMGWYSRVKGKKDALSAAQHCVSWWLRTDTLPKQFHDAIYGPLHM